MGLFDIFFKKIAKKRLDARGQYIDILSRSDKPKTEDADKLYATIIELGLTLEEAEADAKAILEVRDLSSVASDIENRNKPAREAFKAMQKHDEETKAINLAREKTREGLELVYRKLASKVSESVTAAECITKIKFKNRNRKIFPN